MCKQIRWPGTLGLRPEDSEEVSVRSSKMDHVDIRGLVQAPVGHGCAREGEGRLGTRPGVSLGGSLLTGILP